jgi:metallo-beta-lactamase class B
MRPVTATGGLGGNAGATYLLLYRTSSNILEVMYMVKALVLGCILLFCSAGIPCVWAQAKAPSPTVTPIAPGVYVHTSYKILDGAPFPSNGLIVDTDDGVFMVDTGWGELPTRQILQWIQDSLQKDVRLCIVTHSHDDRVGGIEVLKEKDIRTISTPLTAEKASAAGYIKPDGILPVDTVLHIGGVAVETFYPGWGHTEDNIVVWLPQERILFGGCFADADLAKWSGNVRTVMSKFPEVELIVPGHQDWSEGTESLEHTLRLLEEK